MSYLLAIDTSTDACSAALLTPQGIVQSQAIAPREHTQRLLPSIKRLLQEQGVSLGQLEAIAFGVGPGSFTGLRIALSTAQGLAYGADLPLLPVSTLLTMAHTAKRLHCIDDDQVIIPSIDARMNEIYWSAYHWEASNVCVPLCQEMLTAPEQLAQSDVAANSQVIGVGSGWHYGNLGGVAKQVMIEVYPEAYDMALIAQKICNQTPAGGEPFVSPLAAVPTYMRNEVSWKKRTRIREQSSSSEST
ncbi:tRNA (adenosine(37)-N6)-threonylcarbamoyltransferase complex dimerization subunit type 1 TsaB [Eionea flava]